MATNIPPHNLRETIDGVLKIIENKIAYDRDTEIEDLLDIVKGPDFPTGAMILGKNGISQAYRTGRGKIKVRAVTEIEPMGNCLLYTAPVLLRKYEKPGQQNEDELPTVSAVPLFLNHWYHYNPVLRELI